MIGKNTRHIPVEVVRAFFGETEYSTEFLNTGHVHQTCLVSVKNGAFILQAINVNVFKNPVKTVENIEMVNNHLKNDDHYLLKVPSLRRDQNGALVYRSTNGDFWRCMEYVDSSKTIEMARDSEQAYTVASSFGAFSASLSSLDASRLFITIPKFHDPLFRWMQFEEAVESSSRSFTRSIDTTIDRLRSYKDIFGAMQQTHFPIKTVHNDPKITNVLFDLNDRPISIIDLDTVMPGISLHDFGDMVRSMASSATEDHPNISEVFFNKTMYDAIRDGFMKKAGSTLSSIEIDHLSLGAKYMVMEQAVRFFSDYLNGNTYYKVHNDEHNLIRAQNQLALLDSMIKELT
ncbi:MAG: phosphotransferase [Saprospiraceae bacterium]|nr:phosphotransferase [Saprospiraceae bacterium]